MNARRERCDAEMARARRCSRPAGHRGPHRSGVRLADQFQPRTDGHVGCALCGAKVEHRPLTPTHWEIAGRSRWWPLCEACAQEVARVLADQSR